MTHHRMRLPKGKGIALGGSALEPDAEGCVLVPVEHLAEARRHGLTPAPPAIRSLDAAEAATAAASSDAAADMDATDATVRAQKKKGRTA